MTAASASQHDAAAFFGFVNGKFLCVAVARRHGFVYHPRS
jgi:hypothetical protein